MTPRSLSWSLEILVEIAQKPNISIASISRLSGKLATAGSHYNTTPPLPAPPNWQQQEEAAVEAQKEATEEVGQEEEEAAEEVGQEEEAVEEKSVEEEAPPPPASQHHPQPHPLPQHCASCSNWLMAKTSYSKYIIVDTRKPKQNDWQLAESFQGATTAFYTGDFSAAAFVICNKPQPICLANAHDAFGTAESWKWKWSFSNCENQLKEDGDKLKILKSGLYVVYVQVTHKPVVNIKGVANSTFTVLLQKITNGSTFNLNKRTEYIPFCYDCTPTISMWSPYQLEKNEELKLYFEGSLPNSNLKNQSFPLTRAMKNQTFWGVYEIHTWF
ncbi:uncharacterized protein LOC115472455 [Microcaecilia unicolor]|uniref:Uncharacterized protein LOC115472455 n=1 Tax=Microcaecilia unicolor TaxID=1415580 RepID=A0A6P7YHU7_9AMPH|nr:uncharacterized protein LOC115472455 [Microcaecilia unicolor]